MILIALAIQKRVVSIVVAEVSENFLHAEGIDLDLIYEECAGELCNKAETSRILDYSSIANAYETRDHRVKHI